MAKLRQNGREFEVHNVTIRRMHHGNGTYSDRVMLTCPEADLGDATLHLDDGRVVHVKLTRGDITGTWSGGAWELGQNA